MVAGAMGDLRPEGSFGGSYPANLMFYFPPANLADFYLGATAAALAKLHRPAIRRWLKKPSDFSGEPSSAPLLGNDRASGLPVSWSGSGWRARWRSHVRLLLAASVTDLCMVAFACTVCW